MIGTKRRRRRRRRRRGRGCRERRKWNTDRLKRENNRNVKKKNKALSGRNIMSTEK